MFGLWVYHGKYINDLETWLQDSIQDVKTDYNAYEDMVFGKFKGRYTLASISTDITINLGFF